MNIASGNLLATLMGGGVLYLKFQKEYKVIISEAKTASQWQEKVTSIQKSLSTASGNRRLNYVRILHVQWLKRQRVLVKNMRI